MVDQGSQTIEPNGPCKNCQHIQKLFEKLCTQLNVIENLSQNSIYSIMMNINLINDLLDLAKIEQCKFSLNQEYFNIENIIQQAFETL